MKTITEKNSERYEWWKSHPGATLDFYRDKYRVTYISNNYGQYVSDWFDDADAAVDDARRHEGT